MPRLIMTNTLENKKKFIAQYWDQEVMLSEVENKQTFKADEDNFHRWIPECYLELTPLSLISDEDAEKCVDILFSENHVGYSDKVEYGKNWANTVFNLPLNGIYLRDYIPMMDYLRSKGYALPYIGVKVETLIEWNWIKLKTK